MKKKHVLIVGAIIMLGGFGFVGYQINENRREEARMAEEQREIEEAYRWLHYAVGILGTGGTGSWDFVNPSILERSSVYRPFGSFSGEPNDHGIFWWQYLILRMYYHRGYTYLSYEMLIDYFSEEFESDGTRRLYNNGRHPEIEAFVVWMREGLRSEQNGEFDRYWESLDRIRNIYTVNHRDQGFRSQLFYQLSPQMFDALARAEADPDYVLDLTSLQEQGY